MTEEPETTDAGRTVRAFYDALPFNFYGGAEAAAASVRRNPLSAYPDLEALLEEPEVARVLELGCGAGWAANAMALHHGKQVTGVDFTPRALERARAVAADLGIAARVTFTQADILALDLAETFDLVVSIGALHHTADCRAAFARAAAHVAPGGFLFVGLYHLHGRRPFLDLFREICATQGEEAAFARFRQMSPERSDPTHLRSWFRDQVLNPHETQHTLAEAWSWLDAEGLALCTTNLNGYDAPDDRAAVLAAEPRFEALSRQRNREEGRYFPGFFTILAQRPG